MLEHIGGNDFEVESASTDPQGVSLFAVKVLAEEGIDWSDATSQPLDLFLGRPFDYVITVCDRARQTCPVFPVSGSSHHWGIEHPAEVEGTGADKLAAFRLIGQELTLRLRPIIEIARRTAGLPVGGAIGGRGVHLAAALGA